MSAHPHKHHEHHHTDTGARLVWTLSSKRIALSAHLLVESFAQWPQVLATARHVLQNKGIAHVTLQPESTVQSVRWLHRDATEDVREPLT